MGVRHDFWHSHEAELSAPFTLQAWQLNLLSSPGLGGGLRAFFWDCHYGASGKKKMALVLGLSWLPLMQPCHNGGCVSAGET